MERIQWNNEHRKVNPVLIHGRCSINAGSVTIMHLGGFRYGFWYMCVWECACSMCPCLCSSLLHPTSITMTPTSQELMNSGPKGCESGLWIWIPYLSYGILIWLSPQKGQPMVIYKADLTTDADHSPMIRLFPCGLKHFPGASSGQMWPESHARYSSPAPLCSQDKLWGIFLRPMVGLKSFTRVLAFFQETEDFPGLAWRDGCRVSWELGQRFSPSACTQKRIGFTRRESPPLFSYLPQIGPAQIEWSCCLNRELRRLYTLVWLFTDCHLLNAYYVPITSFIIYFNLFHNSVS